MGMGRRGIAAVAAGAIATAGLAAGAVAATTNGANQADDLATAINARAGTSVSAADVTAAYQDLLKARLGEAVTAGTLTQAQADEMLQRAKDNPGLPGLGGPGGPGHGRGGPHADVLGPVATKLTLTEAQIRAELEAGSTLTAIAKAKGVTRADLIATIRAALKADGVPAARTADLAAHIADENRSGHAGPRDRGGRP